MLTKKGQLERKELQNISLAGELAALMSKYRRIEDRLRVKDSSVSQRRASEATFKIKTITAETGPRLKLRKMSILKSWKKKKSSMIWRISLLSQDSKRNRHFHREPEWPLRRQQGCDHAEATSNGSVKQSPAEGTPVAGTAISFFAKLLRSKESTGGQ